MKIELSFDDGSPMDLVLCALLRKFDFPATFYIPSNSKLTVSEIQALSMYYEIGGHTASHPHDLKMLSDGDLSYELKQNKIYLEHILQRPIRKFCYPRGRYDERVIEAVKAVGYTEARTTLVGFTDLPEQKFRWHTTVHISNSRKEYGKLSWHKYAKLKWLEAIIKPDGYFHLWGHSWEIEEQGLWDELYEFLKFMKEEAGLE